MEALYSFLNGSYPIVVSDDFITPAAISYQKHGFEGLAVDLPVGRYTYDELVAMRVIIEEKDKDGNIVFVDSTSRMWVKPGYKVIGYYEDNFQGNPVPVSTDENGYTGDFGPSNDLFRSIEVIADGGSQKEINANRIDNSSYMYEFASTVLEEKRTNFYVYSDIDDDSELFKFYLNRPKATLVDTKANGTLIDNVYYLQPKGRNTYELEYTFKIQNNSAASANTKYQCNLYIDANADGKFSELEKLDDVDIYGNGKPYKNNELTADVNYTVYRLLPEGYKGVLPWKLEVKQVGNDNVYCYLDGYTKLEGMEKEVLNILQISRDRVGSPDWWGGLNEKLFSLAEEINGKKTVYNNATLEAYSVDEKVTGYEKKLYHTLVYGGTYNGVEYKGIADDFEINVDFMTISRFENLYNSNQINLDNYNMLILGFSDAYGDFEGDAESGPMGAIVEFIKSGKSVLFAHDNASYFNYDKKKPNGSDRVGLNRDGSKSWAMQYYGEYHNASTQSKFIRDLVGMDHYGIKSLPALQKGTGLNTSSASWNEVMNSGKDVAYVPKSGRTAIVPETHGYTYSIINAKDKFNATSSTTYTPSETGLNEDWRNRYLNVDYGTVYYEDSTKDNGEIGSPRNGEVSRLVVTKTNDGQITQYPYVLADEFVVSKTHSQYYQLDFTADDDEDGQTDLVVWYCLGPRKTSSGTYQETIYSMSPNDALNNYYIYSKGNVTYTGMGHNATEAANLVDEAKLFINTMIASYKVGLKPPVITALEKGEADSPEKTVLYRAFDTIIGEDGTLSETALDSSDENATFEDANEKIYFTVKDNNIVKGKREISVKFYYEESQDDATQIISYNGEAVPVLEVANREERVFDAATNTLMDPDKLVSGGIYYVMIPKSILLNCENGMGLYFEAQSTVLTNNDKNIVTTASSYDEIQVLKIPLYDLE